MGNRRQDGSNDSLPIRLWISAVNRSENGFRLTTSESAIVRVRFSHRRVGDCASASRPSRRYVEIASNRTSSGPRISTSISRIPSARNDSSTVVSATAIATTYSMSVSIGFA